MSERKVLNKYYPPEFDPSKIPKLRVKKTGVFSIRVMAPFNMRCDTCGEYIYKGKKFNSRKENVDDEFYLGLRIFRFYIKCPRCVAEIAFKTDLANTDYALEAGATRLFEAEKLAHQMAEKERKEKEEDELNPMKMLENRTKTSRNEIEQLDQLEELRELNARHARVDHENMIQKHLAFEEQLLKLQEEEEDNLVKAIMRKGRNSQGIKRIEDKDDEDSDAPSEKRKKEDTGESSKNPSDILVEGSSKETPKEPTPKESWQRSVGSFSKKTSLVGLVKKKTPVPTASPASSTSSTCTHGQANSGQTPNLAGENKPQSLSALTNGSAGSSNSSAPSGPSGLSLLGDYSDSDESN